MWRLSLCLTSALLGLVLKDVAYTAVVNVYPDPGTPL